MAREALEKSAKDHGKDKEAFRKDLINIARTTLSSKILTQKKQFFAELAVNAVMRLRGRNNLESIQIIKSLGGALSDSYLDEGFLLQKKVRCCVVQTCPLLSLSVSVSRWVPSLRCSSSATH